MSIIGRSIRRFVCRIFRSANESAFETICRENGLILSPEVIRRLNHEYCELTFIGDEGWMQTRKFFWEFTSECWKTAYYKKAEPALSNIHKFCVELMCGSVANAIFCYAATGNEERTLYYLTR